MLHEVVSTLKSRRAELLAELKTLDKALAALAPAPTAATAKKSNAKGKKVSPETLKKMQAAQAARRLREAAAPAHVPASPEVFAEV